MLPQLLKILRLKTIPEMTIVSPKNHALLFEQKQFRLKTPSSLQTQLLKLQ